MHTHTIYVCMDIMLMHKSKYILCLSASVQATEERKWMILNDLNEVEHITLTNNEFE